MSEVLFEYLEWFISGYTLMLVFIYNIARSTLHARFKRIESDIKDLEESDRGKSDDLKQISVTLGQLDTKLEMIGSGLLNGSWKKSKNKIL